MAALKLTAIAETIRLAQPFRIAGHVFETSNVVVVTVSDGHCIGRGEGDGVFFLGDDVAHMLAGIEQARPAIEQGAGRNELREILPPGGARNAIDCALWELEATKIGAPVWQLAGLPAPRPLRTTFTLGADSPEVMARGAVDYADAKAIKIKLTGDIDLDIARVRAIRAARPDVWLGVDGNQGFAIGDMPKLIDAMVDERVSLIEQPLPRGSEADLDGLSSPIPLAGDESILSFSDLAGAVGRYDVVNIKLDKCGGLTEGLLMAAEARRLGLEVMVGNMVGTSLAMAPGFVLGQLCGIVDLDGPTFLAQDRQPGVTYADGNIWAGPEVWGAGFATVA